MVKQTKDYVPKWAGILYFSAAVILVPWIVNLAQNLPVRHVSRNWDTLWVGFDIILLIVTIVTVYFVTKRSIWLVVSASVLATLFMVDTWFDILTSRPGRDQRQAILLGFIEMGMAFLTLRLVYQVMKRAVLSNNMNVQIHKDDPKKSIVSN
jgi:hypothetical protein